MRTTLRIAGLSWLLVSPVAAQEMLRGSFEGVLAQGGSPVRTVLHLDRDDAGTLSGTVDSPEQDVFGLDVADVMFDAGALSFRVPDAHATWEGRLDEASGRWIGVWKQRGAELDLVFERTEVDALVGTWQGSGDFGGIPLRIVLHVGTRADGQLGANLQSPDQSPGRIPVDKVEVGEDGSVRIEVPAIGATYEGRRGEGARQLKGHLLQGGGRFALDLEKVGAPSVRRRPQTPRPPFPYRVEEVTYANERGGNRLAGTLTLPAEGGPFPAVVLISGSGSQDRNEEIFGHQPFLVIADCLTREGIAVLRFDDRGVGGSTGDVASSTSADLATDVHAGVDFLRERPDIQGRHIGLVGHSEGGLIAPLVAIERDDIAFLVLLAGPGVRGDELLYLQAGLLAKVGGADEAACAAIRAQQEELFAVLRTESEADEVRLRLREVLLRTGGEAALAQLDQVSSPWFRFFVNHDPVPPLREVSCPVLAINGSLDLQVSPRENLGGIAAALTEGGNEDFEVKEYPGMNHLFQRCTTGAVAEYAEIEETIAPVVLTDLATWIKACVREP